MALLHTVRDTSQQQVDYALTPFGRSLAEPVRQLAMWAFSNLDVFYGDRLRYVTPGPVLPTRPAGS
jgi:DNA-binding HxlR family transcriptional regulator